MKLLSFQIGISSNSMRSFATCSSSFSVSLASFRCGLWGYAVDISALRRGKVGVTPWKSRGNAVENSASHHAVRLLNIRRSLVFANRYSDLRHNCRAKRGALRLRCLSSNEDGRQDTAHGALIRCMRFHPHKNAKMPNPEKIHG